MARTPSSRSLPRTSELAVIFSQSETSPVSSNGPSTSVSRDKSVFFSNVSRFLPPSTSSPTPWTRTKVSNRHAHLHFSADKVLKLLSKYQPETKQEKKLRLKAAAEKGGAGKTAKPNHIKFGLNHVTTLVEEDKAKLVLIAHDVDPIETIVHLPTLCRRKNVPYAFIRGKATLGKLVHLKTATSVALTEVNKEDMQDVETLKANFREQFNNNEKLRRHWGGGVMGIKNQHMVAALQRIKEIELAKKANM
jgi:ribosomal protein L7Ae-like RNA K-turn-binding protein